MNLESAYTSLLPAFETISEFAVDEQTDLSERLSLLEAMSGPKPSFVAFLDRTERVVPFQEIPPLLPGNVFFGFSEADVHHRYRPLWIDDAEMAALVDAKSRILLPTFWVTSDEPIAKIFRSGSQASVSDDVLLGYPTCCAQWHYDAFIARGIEAFCAVAKLEASEEMFDYLRNGWEPGSGFYLPTPFFKAAILRSNWRFPFIDHFACPQCVSNASSPSATLNHRRSELALSLDPELHGIVASWANTQEPHWREVVHDRSMIIQQYVEEWTDTVRGRDEYAKRSRHLTKAMGF